MKATVSLHAPRAQRAGPPADGSSNRTTALGRLELDPVRRVARSGSRRTALTRAQWELAELLAGASLP